MDIEQAKKIGKNETLRWTLYIFLIGELFFMFL